MGTPRRGSFRLMIVSAAAAGVVLAAPIAANADEAPPTEPAPTEASPPAEVPDVPITDVTTDQAISTDVIVAESVTEPLTIDLIIEETPQPAPSSGDDQSDGDTAPPAPTTAAATLEEPTGGGHTGTGGEAGTGDEHTGGEGGHTGGEGGHTGGEGGHTGGEGGHTGGEGGHTGGGGQGDPYRMTFSVTWRSPDDKIIPPDLLPDDVRSMFDLAAASATGGGKPTAAQSCRD